MRALITTQVFPPEIHPTAVMVDDLARGLAARGWAITVAAGLPHHPTGIRPPEYGGALRAVEQRDGYRAIRVWHPTTPRRDIPSRMFVMATQAGATSLAAVTSGRPDVVLSFGGPPLLGPVLSGVLAGVWRIPLVTVIHDLYPDVALETGSVRNRMIIRAARWAERLQYRLSDQLIVLGEAMRTALVEGKRVPNERVEVLPVWLDPDEIRPGERDNSWRRELGIGPEKFVVLYSGTAGIISGAEILAEVARRLSEEVVVVLVGGGTAWSALEAQARAGNAPPNLRLVPYQPREKLSLVQASSDLSIVTLSEGRGRTSVPSKVQGYMAAGRPVLAVVEDGCDTAALVKREGIGRVVPPGDVNAIVGAIESARRDPVQLARWGQTARDVFERQHAREPVLDRYDAILRRVAGSLDR